MKERGDDQPPAKKQKQGVTTASGATSAPVTKETDDPVKKLKDKVRFLAMQKVPSEQLVLLTLDELADTARKLDHADADLYQELARQANQNQGDFKVPNFILNVLGGKASDLISKALSKSLKEKVPEKKEDNLSKSAKDTASGQMQYPWTGQGFMWPYMQPGMGYMPQNVGFGHEASARFTPFARGGSSRTPYRQRGACHFCESTSHLIRDCEKMKQAKHK